MKEKREYFECVCGTQLLSMSYDTADEWCQLDMAFWELGHARDGRTPFRRKLHLVKQILKTGRPYADMIILDTENAGKAREFISEYEAHAKAAIDKRAEGIDARQASE